VNTECPRNISYNKHDLKMLVKIGLIEKFIPKNLAQITELKRDTIIIDNKSAN
jgi:hypothetical protein